MRTPLATGRAALASRLMRPGQVAATSLEAEMPPYMESFLAHLRLLVGVPFEYLVPDPRLLPDESIRFFYLDRSWTDRLVDGAVAVGKIGSREQAHHQAQNAKLAGTLDVGERMVRTLQRGRKNFVETRGEAFGGPLEPAQLVTGFLLRSALVSGWPHMEIRAYRQRIRSPFDAGAPTVVQRQLPLLRLERLSPGVMLALFEGVPRLVTLEEPHAGVQFGIHVSATGNHRAVPLRAATGQLLEKDEEAIEVALPRRASRTDVIHVAQLRDRLKAKAATVDDHGRRPVTQNGSAAFAIAVLDPPWRQRFEGTVDHGDPRPSPPARRPQTVFEVAERVHASALRLSVASAFSGGD